MLRTVVLLALCICVLSGCQKKHSVKFVVAPDLPIDFKSKIYFQGTCIGEVSNLAMDANYCYATVAFHSESDAAKYGCFEIEQDNTGRLTLVSELTHSADDKGFKW